LLSAGLSHADLTGEYGGGDIEVAEPTRRGGFTLGLSGNYGTGSFSGYRNKLQEIGRPEYQTEVAGNFYSGGSLWLGSAVTDWLTFGFGLTGGSSTDSGNTAAGGALVVHIESFPLFSLGGAYEDFGLLTEFGGGSVRIVDENDDAVAEGGSMSTVNVGVFWQPWQWWHLSFGPSATYSYMSSPTLSAHTVGLGFRTTFYATSHDAK
jgi:hypothetical protein